MIITDEKLLRRPCEEVLPEEIDNLISVLENELNYINKLGRGGIGLAAPQIGILKKIAIIRMPKINLNLVNATMIAGYDSVIFKNEGCLSVPNRVENTIRFQEILISNNLVEPYSFIATGLLAVAVQHELDHLNSILFMDRMVPKQTISSKSNKIGPNELCLCGSNKKYKKCCGR